MSKSDSWKRPVEQTYTVYESEQLEIEFNTPYQDVARQPGMIWAPEEKWAEEVIEECASFPYGDHDDLVDSMTQAVMRFRQGGLLSHPEDYKDEPLQHREKVYY